MDGHCILEQNEKMIAIGNISQPHPTGSMRCYAERWLANGLPYEFNIMETPCPPPDLVKEFHEIVGDGVLSLYFSGSEETSLKLEWAEGRKNIMTDITEPPEAGTTLETTWMPGGLNPVRMICTIHCDSRTTHNGGVHKNTKSHWK